jgi:23S rRNA (cytidine1920-2'-O)/16S rRNA (cytidine1409-2'-O)-methyltransferase
MAGLILHREIRIDKAGELISANAQLRRKGANRSYVSRGGEKLASAIKITALDPSGWTVLDLGASTGGFTDCLLQAGAARVFAVDVGTNQLDYKIRQDPRVIVHERTHAKVLSKTLIGEPLDLVVGDVSFTSLRQVLPYTFPLLKEKGQLLVLFKPQFELPREAIDVGGIVTDQDLVSKALKEMSAWFEAQELQVKSCFKCGIKGREGNQEYFFWCQRT